MVLNGKVEFPSVFSRYPGSPKSDLLGPPSDLGSSESDLLSPPLDLGSPKSDLLSPPSDFESQASPFGCRNKII